jgi:hypothetical protein
MQLSMGRGKSGEFAEIINVSNIFLDSKCVIIIFVEFCEILNKLREGILCLTGHGVPVYG